MIRVRAAWLLLSCGCLVSRPVLALSEDDAKANAEQAIADVSTRLDEVLKAAAPSQPTPQERLATGEVLLRQNNYEAAINAFSQVVELYRQQKTSAEVHADAVFSLGESYFRDDQLLAARRQYLEVVNQADEAPYQSHAGRALGRLVDVALRTQRLGDLDLVLGEVERLSRIRPSTALRYAKAKALFALRRYGEAERLLVSLPKGASVYPQGQYILGVIFMNRALGESATPPTKKEAADVPPAARRFAKAILQFQKVTQLKVDREEHLHVVDLAWMALGRLFYEVDDVLDAAEAHARVRRTSPAFADMLFELSWVYVRLGDYERAERGLEVLGIVNPDKLNFAEGALLRADLMLRSKQHEPALAAYRSVRRRFEPIQDEVEAFVGENTEPGQYYDRLIEDQLGVKTRGALPPVVMDWLREESSGERVFDLIHDITTARSILNRSRRTILRLESVLGSDVRVRGFPDLAMKLRGVVGLLNQLSLARRDLALGLEAANDTQLAGAIGAARANRRKLMERLDWFPTGLRDFSRREASGLRRWNSVSQKLQRAQLEVDRLQAIANGLRRLLREKSRFGVALNGGREARIRQELSQTEREVKSYVEAIEEHRETVERARLQIGFGDARYRKDDLVREEFRRHFEREFELALVGQAGADAAEFARGAKAVVDRIAALEQKLSGIRGELDAEVAERATLVEAEVREEQAKLLDHIRQLEEFDREARVSVGEAAMHNFAAVRERLKGIVLRADVGIAHQAWEVRETHRERVQKLQRERTQEERALTEERDEVLFSGEQEGL